MKPIEFKDQNVVYAKDQPEYLPLPALRIDGNLLVLESFDLLKDNEVKEMLYGLLNKEQIGKFEPWTITDCFKRDHAESRKRPKSRYTSINIY